MKKTSKERRDDLFYESLRSYIEALNANQREFKCQSFAVREAARVKTARWRDLAQKHSRNNQDLALTNFLWTQRTTEPLDPPKVLTVQFLNGEIKKRRCELRNRSKLDSARQDKLINDLAVLERQKALLLALTWIDTGVENAHQIEDMGLAHEDDLDGG